MPPPPPPTPSSPSGYDQSSFGYQQPQPGSPRPDVQQHYPQQYDPHQHSQPQYPAQPLYPQSQYPPRYAQPDYNQQAYSSGYSEKSRVTAGILGLLLGGLGAHRFYLGYPGIAVLQILVTILTLGVGALWGVIEGILILAGSDSFRTDANGLPLRG
jgi:TM2 domain-containing membrane protein YozV